MTCMVGIEIPSRYQVVEILSHLSCDIVTRSLTHIVLLLRCLASHHGSIAPMMIKQCIDHDLIILGLNLIRINKSSCKISLTDVLVGVLITYSILYWRCHGH